jgi:adenosylmethionine-8-amino-7-oxononanoate aminotransferase
MSPHGRNGNSTKSHLFSRSSAGLLRITKGEGVYVCARACIVSDEVAKAFKEPFAHGHTYGSHPVACAAGVAVLDYVKKHNLVQRSAELGEYLHERLRELYEHPAVGDVRGMGIFAGVEFVKEKGSKKPFPAEIGFSRRVLERCIENGLLVYPGTATVDGFLGDHIQVAPPLVVTREEIDEIVAILDASIVEAEGEIL